MKGQTILLLTLTTLQSQATMLDLSNFNGPVSALDHAVLEIHGGCAAHSHFGNLTDFMEATVANGVIQCLYTGTAVAPMTSTFSSSLLVNFLEPVTDISFGLAAWRGSGFHYIAENNDGTQITGLDGYPDASVVAQFEFRPFAVDLPDGYYFTALEFFNSDPKPVDGALWVNNVNFTSNPSLPHNLNRVPEQASTAGLLLVGLAAMVAGRARKPQARVRK